MIWKHLKEKLSEEAIKKFAETYHLAYVIAPIFALIVSIILGTDKLLLEFIFILFSLFFNFTILYLNAKTTEKKFEEEENDRLSLLYTFFYDALKPLKNNSNEQVAEDDKKQNEVVFDIEIAVIEAQNTKSDSETSYYIDDLIKKFEENPEKKHKRISDRVPGLTFKKLHCNPNINDKEIVQNSNQLKKWLSKVEAIVVVRTKELDEIDWVYQTVDSWAYDNSEVPVLFATDSNLNLQENKFANRFKPISNDSKSLPWYLLKRANDRGKQWRIQATFNRAIAWNIIFFIILLAYFGIISMNTYFSNIEKLKTEQEFQKSKADVKILTDGMYNIFDVKREFLSQFNENVEPDVFISYWFTYDNEPNIFVTTEEEGTTDNFRKDTTSIIGCGYVKPNRIIDWRASTKKTNIWDLYNEPDQNLNCDMTKLENSPINNIVCGTYNDPNYSEKIVGICIFTKTSQKNNEETLNKLFEPSTRDFLFSKLKDYFSEFEEPIIKNKLTPWSKRRIEEEKKETTH